LENGYIAFAPELARDSDNFDVMLFKQLAKLEPGNFWFESRNQLLIWAIRRYFPSAKSFMEIGCGTGFVLSGLKRQIPELVLSGSDVYFQGLEYAQARVPGSTLFQMDARSIPFENEFDVIGAFDILEHIVEDNVAIGQMYQAAKPGGGILLTVPQHKFLWSAADVHAYHKRRYTRKGLIEKVKSVGFEIVRVTSFVSLLFPLMFLARRKRPKPPGECDPLADLKIKKSLNILLRKLLSFERFVIELGFSFPVGGSLLLIGRKP
jgi:SAM-dependent methyltransferase